jgi:serine protease inhibitor
LLDIVFHGKQRLPSGEEALLGVFHVNQAFLVFIVEETAGVIRFLGWIEEPQAS